MYYKENRKQHFIPNKFISKRKASNFFLTSYVIDLSLNLKTYKLQSWIKILTITEPRWLLEKVLTSYKFQSHLRIIDKRTEMPNNKPVNCLPERECRATEEVVNGKCKRCRQPNMRNLSSDVKPIFKQIQTDKSTEQGRLCKGLSSK